VLISIEGAKKVKTQKGIELRSSTIQISHEGRKNGQRMKKKTITNGGKENGGGSSIYAAREKVRLARASNSISVGKARWFGVRNSCWRESLSSSDDRRRNVTKRQKTGAFRRVRRAKLRNARNWGGKRKRGGCIPTMRAERDKKGKLLVRRL